MSYTIEQIEATAIAAVERFKTEMGIVGWMVGTPGDNPAMYNLSQKGEAFCAAKRWKSPITALVLHPAAPALDAPTVGASHE